MNTTKTVLFPTPPSTSNTMGDRQRIRLMRSTRKLGSVLGTTPQFVEVTAKHVPHPILLPIGAKHSSHSRPGTPESIKRVRRNISLFTAPSSASNLIYSSSSCNSSTTTLSLASEGRASPQPKITLTPAPSSKRIPSPRGPRPLVLNLKPIHSAVPSPSSLPSTPSTATTLAPSPITPSPISPLSPVFPTPAESRRKRMAKLARTLGENIPPHLVLPSKRPTTPTFQTSFSVSSVGQGRNLMVTRKRRSMSVDFASGAGAMPACGRSSRIWVTESKTWRGEWNRRNIQDVQKQLRSLKAR